MDAIWKNHLAGKNKGNRGVLENWYNLQNGIGKVLVRFEVIEVTNRIPRLMSKGSHRKVPGLLSVFLGTMEAEFPCKVRAYLYLESKQDERSKEVEEYITPEPPKKAAKRNDLNINKVFIIDDVYSENNKITIKLWDSKAKECIGKTEYKVKECLPSDCLERKPFQFASGFLKETKSGDEPAKGQRKHKHERPEWADPDVPIVRMKNPGNSLPSVTMQMQLTVYALLQPLDEQICINEAFSR